MNPQNTPEIVPFYKAEIPRDTCRWVNGKIINLSDGRSVEAWVSEDSDRFLIRIFRQTLDSKISELSFGLSYDAAAALHDVLCAQLFATKQNPQ